MIKIRALILVLAIISPFGIAGAVVVGPHASELIHVLTLAIQQRLTADEVAATFTVYPSLSGSIAEAARRLHIIEE